jgi:hypothetical protein
MKHPRHAAPPKRNRAPRHAAPPKRYRAPYAVAGVIVGALTVTAATALGATSSDTLSLEPATSLTVTCPNALSDTGVSSTGETLNCAADPTSTAPPTAATATIPPTPTTPPASSGEGPVTSEHYTANGNLDGSTYLPGSLGFNLADTESEAQTEALPSGVKALVWVGTCDGATSSFDSGVQSFVGDAKVFGFYLMDEPNPSTCPAANLKAESDYVHATLPGAKTFIIEQDLNESADPDYYDGYGPANSDIDLYGLDPYPCRTENPPSAPCAYNWIDLAVEQAESSAVGTNSYGETGADPDIPAADIVPVYQAFGGGAWVDDQGGSYQLPTAAQEQQILATWASVVPSPVFDYAYSYGVQMDDSPLSTAPASLQEVFEAHNG